MLANRLSPRKIHPIGWLILALFVVIVCYYRNSIFISLKPFYETQKDTNMDFSDLRKLCFKGKYIDSVESLGIYLNNAMLSKSKKCRQSYDLFHSIYNIRIKYTQIYVSNTFRERLEKWLNGDKNLIRSTENQSLVFIDNLYSHESVVFNPVRSNRPGVSSNSTFIYLQKLLDSSKTECDFCSYEKYTASDSFGYMKSKHAVVVSNAFKIEMFHGMLLLFNHDYKNISETQFLSGINLALKWFQKTHSLIPSHEYRIMYWDILPKASASQVHPHLHLTLGDYSYYSKWNSLYHTALHYSSQNKGSSYFQQLIDIHDTLGLVFK